MHKPELIDAQAIQRAVEIGQLRLVPDPIIRSSLASLDQGERTALELAIQYRATLLIDEKIGRQFAKNHSIKLLVRRVFYYALNGKA